MDYEAFLKDLDLCISKAQDEAYESVTKDNLEESLLIASNKKWFGIGLMTAKNIFMEYVESDKRGK